MIAAIPCEVFAETGLAIKQASTGKPAQEAIRFGKLKLDTLTGSDGVKVTIKESKRAL